jgi:uncharacterized protein YcfJ
MSNTLKATVILAGLGLAGTALADHGPRPQVVFAPVIDVAPLVRQVAVTRPRQECWLETAIVPSYGAAGRGVAPVIAGGLIGGVIGHQIGHGSRNRAMTVLGTLVGSAIASDAAAKQAAYASNAGYGREVTTQRCETVSETFNEERIDGYRVTYEYMGQRYATIMPEPPRGDRIRLHVTIEAAGY